MNIQGKFSFRAKHVLLTGAGGGLGSALGRELVLLGAKLVFSDRSHEKLKNLITSLPEDSTIIPVQADLSITDEVEKLASQAVSALGHIDVLINNAGIAYHALMEETIETKIQHVFQVNTFAPLALIKALLPMMKRRSSGRVINILSCAGFLPAPTTGTYGASKSALSAMARALRLELAPSGIDIINVYPGPIATAFNENALSEKSRSGVHACATQGTHPDTIAKKILSVASGPHMDVWLDRKSKWIALKGMFWQKWTDRYLTPLRDEVLASTEEYKPHQERRWRLLQIETSIACNMNCLMCPWKGVRRQKTKDGDLSKSVWEKIRPHLAETKSVDFSGGGEPLLQPMLDDWIREASAVGCETGFLTNGIILDQKKIDQYIQAGLNWIGFSIDGATAEIYEKIRIGSDFQKVCKNIATVSDLREKNRPRILINFVLMSENFHQVEDIVHLAAELGVNQVNFKQCDVIRGEHGRGYGLFVSKETRKVRRLKKALNKARHLAKKLRIETNAFSFVPDELPVCIQDPRNSMFIRHDGSVAPCINLANGGQSSFLGKNVTIPTIHYGRLQDHDLMELWESETCRFYRNRFEQRAQAYDAVIAGSSFEPSLIKLEETLTAARKAMPEAPDGCKVCHYLFGI